MLKRIERAERFTISGYRLQAGCRVSPYDKKLAVIVGVSAKFNFLAEQIPIQVVEQHLLFDWRRFEPHGIVRYKGMHVRENSPFDTRDECLAAAAGSHLDYVVGAKPLEKGSSVRALQFDLNAIGEVKHGGRFPSR
jgi:hypothetical protein